MKTLPRFITCCLERGQPCPRGSAPSNLRTWLFALWATVGAQREIPTGQPGRKMFLLFLAVALLGTMAARGDGTIKTNSAAASAQASEPTPPGMTEDLSVTPHSMMLDGRTLNYTATAGYMLLKDDEGRLRARIFFVAYTKDGVPDRARRPISFAFNGGPGASSVFLHLGGLGPRRVLLAVDGTELPNADKLVDNAYTWLGFSDLVFVDPVGTGYSRAARGVDAKPFYDVHKDIDAAGDFIRLYVTKYERWLSPKFVIGESYGTTRAAGLASYLQSKTGMDLAGVILLSTALDFQAFDNSGGNELPYALDLPTFTAVASYHHKLPSESPAELSQTLGKVEHWALNGYLTALAKGDTLTAAERSRVVARLAEYTGLSTNYIEKSRCRIGAQRFTKELLRDENRTVGLLDGRVLGIDTTRLGEYPQYDPALFLVTGPYTTTLNDYLRRDLNFKTTLRYEFLSGKVNRDWKWDIGGQGYLYVADQLAQAMSRDKRLRVFVGAGMYDLTTPYLGQKYVFDHLGLDPGLHRNITFKLYPSGHQIYTDQASLKKLQSDVAAFVKSARGQQSGDFRK